MATELPTNPQIAVDADRYLAQRVLALEAEVERLRADPRMRLAVEDIRRLMGPPNSPSYGPALRRVEAALAGEGDGDHSRPT